MVEFSEIMDDSAITTKTNGSGHTVTETHCTCLYFSAMEIPCRHLFQFLATKDLELFQPDLCATRWTKAYYYKSHPAINSFEYVPPQEPIHVTRLRVPSEMERYKKTGTITKDINNILSTMSNSHFQYFFEKIQGIRSEMVSEPANLSRETVTRSSSVDEIPSSAAAYPENYRSQSYQQQNRSRSQSTSNSHREQQTFSQPQILSTPLLLHQKTDNVPAANQGSLVQNSFIQDVSELLPVPTFHRQENLSEPSTSTNTFQHIILPTKNVAVGRPKGSGNTVVGLKRKVPPNSRATHNAPPKKMKFVDKNCAEQGILIGMWLTNWPKNQIGGKKITMGDIIQDPHTFNRLRHKQVDLKCTEKFFDKKTFNYILNEVNRLKKRPYVCRKCQRNLKGIQIICHGCLDCYHEQCINPGVRNIEYFCADC